jgi:hypothetical protein
VPPTIIALVMVALAGIAANTCSAQGVTVDQELTHERRAPQPIVRSFHAARTARFGNPLGVRLATMSRSGRRSRARRRSASPVERRVPLTHRGVRGPGPRRRARPTRAGQRRDQGGAALHADLPLDPQRRGGHRCAADCVAFSPPAGRDRQRCSLPSLERSSASATSG